MELEPQGITPAGPLGPHGTSDPVVAEVEAALEAGDERQALELAEAALAAGRGNRLDLLFLSGDALLGLGEAATAEQRFRAVLAEDPECPASRCWLAMALYRQCEFGQAEAAVAAALAVPEPVSDAFVVHGLLLERHGKYREADQAFRRASTLEPEKHRTPVRMSRKEFDLEVDRAVKKLPRQFRGHLDAVPIFIEDLPADDLLRGDAGTNDPDLLGLFCGYSLREMDDGMMGSAPNTNCIYLFQRNIERYARDRQDLVEQIRITLYHEFGHYLGFDEDGVDELGLG